jgi:Ca2+-binding RTX toxin-like protein
MKIGKKPARAAIAVVGAAGIGGIAFLAMPAEAATSGTVSVVSGSRVQYIAATGRINQVVVTRSGNTITVDDTTTAIKAGTGCGSVSGDKTKIRCTLKVTPTWFIASLGDQNDVFYNKTDLNSTVAGGTGNDKLYGGPKVDSLQGNDGVDAIWGQGGNDKLQAGNGNDALSGGDGNDEIWGDAGNDRLLGGNGDDDLIGYSGNDAEDGGAGDDTFFELWDYAAGTDRDSFIGSTGIDAVAYTFRTKPVRADADAVAGDDGSAGEKDTISGTVEGILGGDANDTLVGTARTDVLYGDWGNDLIAASGGDDYLEGDLGKDTLNGASGTDYCVEDSGDSFISCEVTGPSEMAAASSNRKDAPIDVEQVRAKAKTLR